ncbi:MAG: nucleoside-diphosphate sugar epimerase/dehydratase [Anaerolineae bacterium]
MERYSASLARQYIRRISLDVLIIIVAFFLGWLARFDGRVPASEWDLLSRRMVPIITVYVVVNSAAGIYRRLWAYASFRDVIILSETIGLSTLALVSVNFALTGVLDRRLSTGGLMIGGLLTLTLSVVAKYRRQLMDVVLAAWPRHSSPDSERVLIVGINQSAQQLATQMYLGNCIGNYRLVGFVDDEPGGKGSSLNGVRILGTPDKIEALVDTYHIDVIVIARQPRNREDRWRLISACRETSAKVKVLPDLVDFLEGHHEDPLTLRDVSIEDILGRAPASVDFEACRRLLADKVVLVTGAAGSIGSELCRQVLLHHPRLLLALDNNESGLHELNLELQTREGSPLILIVGDITDASKIDSVFRQYSPQIVFHAAAYKHVPLMEGDIYEALRVNVAGTVIVGQVADRYRAERFVFISTDKAVNPSSVMGASKRIGELWMKSLSRRSETVFTTVRFGNVIGSRGSVLPTFTRQIEKGGPVTVTDRAMTRFFMSIPEAVGLVLQAAAFSERDEIYMLEMGEQVSILALAHRMIRLKGLRVDKDIEIRFIGARPGEKLHEELAYVGETARKTAHSRIYQLKGRNGPIDRATLLDSVTALMQKASGDATPQEARAALFEVAVGEPGGPGDQVAALEQPQSGRDDLETDAGRHIPTADEQVPTREQSLPPATQTHRAEIQEEALRPITSGFWEGEPRVSS